jgi:hypothetical protein
MDTSWTLKVNSATDYWDSIHFNEPVYAILNDQLMDMLHKIPSSQGDQEAKHPRRARELTATHH